MCGLVGIFGADITPLEHDLFKWLLVLDSIRGEDSTGIAFKKKVTTSGKYYACLIKNEGTPYSLFSRNPELFDQKDFKMVNKTGERFEYLMGHNRSATAGAVNARNAHPFHINHITGCHNGTILTGLHRLPWVTAELQGETDSEKMFLALAKGWTLQKIVDTVTGAIAFTWYNSKTNTYNLYRNKERPLFFAYNKQAGKVAYASEKWMLEVAAFKSKAFWAKTEIVELAENEHLEFQLDNFSGRVVSCLSSEVKKEYVAPLVQTTVRTVTTPHGGTNTTLGTKIVPFDSTKVPGFLKKEEIQTPNKQHKFELGITGWVEAPKLGMAEFMDLCVNGCSLCGEYIPYSSYSDGEVKWFNASVPVCKDCAEEFVQKEEA